MGALLSKIPWRRVGVAALGGGIFTLGVFVPVVAPVTSVVGTTIMGSAIPHEYVVAAVKVISGVKR